MGTADVCQSMRRYTEMEFLRVVFLQESSPKQQEVRACTQPVPVKPQAAPLVAPVAKCGPVPAPAAPAPAAGAGAAAMQVTASWWPRSRSRIRPAATSHTATGPAPATRQHGNTAHRRDGDTVGLRYVELSARPPAVLQGCEMPAPSRAVPTHDTGGCCAPEPTSRQPGGSGGGTIPACPASGGGGCSGCSGMRQYHCGSL